MKIAVIGGGTAGWLSACHLAHACLGHKESRVTLVESPDIPTIGVGEGTVPAIRRSLKKIGIPESRLFTDCDATFKQSIQFVNWLDRGRHGQNNAYHHLFDAPSPEALKQWVASAGDKPPFSEAVSPQSAVCQAGLAPKQITTPEYQPICGYAYHFDAGKFAKLLAQHAQTKLGVVHQFANICDVETQPDGTIDHLLTSEGQRLSYDFYIDCTGFSARLLGQAQQVPFVSRADELLVNQAITVQIPTDESVPIPPYTIATAHQAGWIWDIALQHRRGVGLVYSNEHLSDEQAIKKLDRYLGGQLDKLSYRQIPMSIGHRQKFWHKNCVAIGLAQGFVEPLEATSILLSDFAADFLSARLPSSSQQFPLLEKRFNQTMGYAWDRVIDFIKLHYFLSDRTDSAFWHDNRDPHSLSDTLKERLALWRDFAPAPEDFFSKFEVFDADNFNYVLYGMGFPTQIEGLTPLSSMDRVKRLSQSMLEQLPQHRQLINKIRQYGLQKC